MGNSYHFTPRVVLLLLLSTYENTGTAVLISAVRLYVCELMIEHAEASQNVHACLWGCKGECLAQKIELSEILALKQL